MGLRLNQIRIDPRVVLGRRGCKIEESIKILSNECFTGTPFEKYYANLNERQMVETGSSIISMKTELRELVRDKFVDILSICRKCFKKEAKTINDKELDLFKRLINFGIINEKNELRENIESFGNLFEWIVGNLLYKKQIQCLREVKVRYPFPNRPYDPDGQLYDILAALDLSKLLWIECKKPLYLDETNPLGQVVSKSNISKFLRRAYFLKPDIAIFLVDTKTDYRNELRKHFKHEFISSGNYIDNFQESDNIIARVNNFIYFNRINFKSNSLYQEGLENSIDQVLYDATKINVSSINYEILK